jgi:hypothetical protein
MTTVVIPYLHRLSSGDELKYAIRSWDKYFNDDFNIVIIGDKPDWFQGDHIPCQPIRGMTFARAFDIALKLELAIASPIISEDFIYTYDDVYLIDSCTRKDFETIRALELMPKGYHLPKASMTWQRLLEATVKKLPEPAWSYETHIPRMFKKEWLGHIIKAYDLRRNALLVSTLYYNEFYEKPDVVLAEHNDFKVGIYDRANTTVINKAIKGKKVLNHSENAYNDSMKRFLIERFVEKSIKFEK